MGMESDESNLLDAVATILGLRGCYWNALDFFLENLRLFSFIFLCVCVCVYVFVRFKWIKMDKSFGLLSVNLWVWL